jgi:hypothetical protein
MNRNAALLEESFRGAHGRKILHSEDLDIQHARLLRIPQQGFESVIHVLLDVAVK